MVTHLGIVGHGTRRDVGGVGHDDVDDPLEFTEASHRVPEL